jgi:GNAT superfamily N-acetyltransferase
MHSDYLSHHGILGQKWGVRRFQNPDGTLTEEGVYHRRATNAAKTKKDVDRIWKSMSLDDRKMMGNDDPKSKEFLSVDEGEYVVKRFLDKDKGTPVAWLDIMTTIRPGHLTVAVGTDPAYRGQGRASKLVKQGVDWFDKNAHKYNATYLGYGAYSNNIGSRRAAEKAGFVYEQDKSNDEWSVYGHKI